MDATTFTITYDVAVPDRATALARASDRLRRALAVGVEYVVRGERCRPDGEAYTVTLLVELTCVAPRLRTNLAFHALFPDATVRAV